jgi:predicted DNA-binding WGR domain protein
MILLSHVEPTDNMNRWYLVSIQSTLFFSCAVIIAWGRRDNSFQQWRAIPVESPDQAQELVDRIVKKKLRRGYRIIQSPFQAANS